jgi:beta-lactamase class A
VTNETTTARQSAFEQATRAFEETTGGRLGALVRDLGTGEELAWNATDTFPTASTMKVPLLYALYRLVDTGEVDLTERVSLASEDRVPGSGVLQHLDPGLNPTVRDLAELMIIVSDNYATDLIYRLVGRDRLAATLADLALGDTYLPHPTRLILAHMVGIDSDDPELTYEAFRERLKGSEPVPGNIYADGEYDRSTPADMVRLLTTIEDGAGLAPESRDAILTMMKHQTVSDRLPARLPQNAGIEVAHKTGSVRGVRNDVGIVYGPELTYAIAIMTKDLPDPTEGTLEIARLSRAIWDLLSAT